MKTKTKHTKAMMTWALGVAMSTGGSAGCDNEPFEEAQADEGIEIVLGDGDEARVLRVEIDGPEVADGHAVYTMTSAEHHAASTGEMPDGIIATIDDDLATGERIVTVGPDRIHRVQLDGGAQLCADSSCERPLTWSGEPQDPLSLAVLVSSLRLETEETAMRSGDVPVGVGELVAEPEVSAVVRECYLLGSGEDGGCYSYVQSCYGGGQPVAVCSTSYCFEGNEGTFDHWCLNV